MAERDHPIEVRSLARTLRRWHHQIVAWHRASVSNGPTEATNNLIKRIKRIKRVGFGFRRFAHYRLRVLLHAGRPNWQPINTADPPRSDEPRWVSRGARPSTVQTVSPCRWTITTRNQSTSQRFGPTTRRPEADHNMATFDELIVDEASEEAATVATGSAVLPGSTTDRVCRRVVRPPMGPGARAPWQDEEASGRGVEPQVRADA
jgi:hypothetical protein